MEANNEKEIRARSKEDREEGQPQTELDMSGSVERNTKQGESGVDPSGERVTGDVGTGTRQTWSNQFDFMVSLLGFAVGLGNLWRFPYLVFKNGGGAFLIPYFIFMVCCGAPLFFLETSLGQLTQQGAINCWRLLPKLKGIGIASTLVVFYCNTYYIVILAWATFYIFSSFIQAPGVHPVRQLLEHALCYETTSSELTLNPNQTVSSAEEFWVRRVTMIYKSGGVEDTGDVVLHLAGSLFFIWAVCFLCLFRGIRVSGKVVYFTAPLPYVLIACFIVRGVTLPGAMEGIMFYLRPDFQKLTEAQVWVDAGTQIFFSYAVCLGVLPTLGSFNKPNHNVLKDSVLISVANPATSFVAGFGVFSMLGYMAHTTGKKVADVTSSGPGLVFKTYPVAISLLPGSNLWAILFFFMIILLGFDSQFAAVESFVSSVSDVVPWLRGSSRRRTLFLLFTCTLHFLIGLTMVTNGGLYIFEIWNRFSASGKNLLLVALAEMGALMYCYGHKKYMGDLERMLSAEGQAQAQGVFYRCVLAWFNFCWRFLSPVMILGLFVFEMLQYFNGDNAITYGEYTYPFWATYVGWLFVISAIACIPGYYLYFLLRQRLCPNFNKFEAYCQAPTVLGQRFDANEKTCMQQGLKNSQEHAQYGRPALEESLT